MDLDCIAEVDGIWCRLGIEGTEGFAQTELCTIIWLSLKAFTFWGSIADPKNLEHVPMGFELTTLPSTQSYGRTKCHLTTALFHCFLGNQEECWCFWTYSVPAGVVLLCSGLWMIELVGSSWFLNHNTCSSVDIFLCSTSICTFLVYVKHSYKSTLFWLILSHWDSLRRNMKWI